MPKRSPHPGVSLERRQRADGVTWYARSEFWGGCRNLTRDYGFTTRKACEAWAIHQSKLQRARRSGVGQALTLREALEGYLQDLERDQLARGTREAYARAACSVVDALGGTRPTNTLTRPDLWAWKRTQEGGTVASLKTKLRRGARFFRSLVLQDLSPLLDSDAIHGVLRVTTPTPKVRVRCLDHGEIRGLLEASEHPYPRHLLLTGMRAGELLGLRWEEVDLGGRAIHLPAARTKTRTARTVHLQLCPTVEDWLHDRSRARGRVYPGETKDTMRKLLTRHTTRGGVYHHVDGPLRQAVPGLRWKDLRSSCASYLHNWARSGFTPMQVADHLGHSLAMAQRRYYRRIEVDPSAQTLEEAMGIACSSGASRVPPTLSGGGEVLRMA